MDRGIQIQIIKNDPTYDVFLDIPFDKKDDIKTTSQSKLVWDKTRKKWKVSLEHPDQLIDPQLEQYIIMYVKIPFAKKDEAKAHGAKWDPVVKCWFYTSDKDGFFLKNNFRHATF